MITRTNVGNRIDNNDQLNGNIPEQGRNICVPLLHHSDSDEYANYQGRRERTQFLNGTCVAEGINTRDGILRYRFVTWFIQRKFGRKMSTHGWQGRKLCGAQWADPQWKSEICRDKSSTALSAVRLEIKSSTQNLFKNLKLPRPFRSIVETGYMNDTGF